MQVASRPRTWASVTAVPRGSQPGSLPWTPVRYWDHGSYGEGHIVIRRRVPCRNCFLSECTVNQLRCLTEINVDEVWSACQRMLIYQ